MILWAYMSDVFLIDYPIALQILFGKEVINCHNTNFQLYILYSNQAFDYITVKTISISLFIKLKIIVNFRR